MFSTPLSSAFGFESHEGEAFRKQHAVKALGGHQSATKQVLVFISHA